MIGICFISYEHAISIYIIIWKWTTFFLICIMQFLSNLSGFDNFMHTYQLVHIESKIHFQYLKHFSKEKYVHFHKLHNYISALILTNHFNINIVFIIIIIYWLRDSLKYYHLKLGQFWQVRQLLYSYTWLFRNCFLKNISQSAFCRHNMLKTIYIIYIWNL